MATTTSPNMNLPVPVVGSEAGPAYAIDINACLNQIDSHDHSSGSGVQITPSGLNINADLPYSSNNATGLRSARFTAHSVPLALAADLGCLYVSGVDLYYNDENGNQVRITQSGGVAGSPGSISNLTSPASASYVAVSSTFVWQSAANTAAIMDFRSAIFRNSSASSFGLTLQAPTLGADYTLTLPAIPGSNSFMTLSSSGTMGAGISQSQGIVTSMIADSNITTAKIADSAVTTAKINDSAVTTAKINDQAVTSAKLAQLNAQASSSCSSFSTSSLTPVDITNLSIAFTSTGRQFMVCVIPDGTVNASNINISSGAGPNFAGTILIKRDTQTIASIFLQASSGQLIAYPVNICCFESVAAGTYTYKAQAVVNNSGQTLGLEYAKILVYEL